MFRRRKDSRMALNTPSRLNFSLSSKSSTRTASHNRMGIAEDQAAFEVLRHLLIAVAQMRVLLAHVGLEPGVLIVHPV